MHIDGKPVLCAILSLNGCRTRNELAEGPEIWCVSNMITHPNPNPSQ